MTGTPEKGTIIIEGIKNRKGIFSKKKPPFGINGGDGKVISQCVCSNGLPVSAYRWVLNR